MLLENYSQNVNSFNSLPNDKIWDGSKLKAFADDRIDVTENWNLFWER